MKFWVVLAITYGTGFLDGEVSYIATPNQAACGELMMEVDGRLRKHFPDLMIQCIPTDVLSETVRPKPRPDWMEK